MLALALAVLSLSLFASAQINTPASAVQCEPALLQWTETGNPPYIISVLPGGQVSAAAIENIGSFTGSSTTWNVDIPAGTSLTLQIRDGTGGTNYSAPFPVQSSSDTSCLGTNSGYVGGSGLPAKSSTGSATGSSSASAASGASSSSASLTSTSASVASSSSSSAAASTSAASTSSASSVIAASTTSHSTTTTSKASTTTPGMSTTPASSPAASPSSNAGSVVPVNVALLGIAGFLGAILVA